MSKPSSPRKIASAKANGAKSNGPVTPEGKAASSKNSTRHGLCAERIVLAVEDREEYEQIYESYVKRFQPADPVELDLVEDMINARWRIRRSITVETDSIEREIGSNEKDLRRLYGNVDPSTHISVAVRALHNRSTSLETVQRYETRLTRQYDKAYKTLLHMRENVPVPNEPNPIIEQPVEPVLAGPFPAPISEPHPENLETAAFNIELPVASPAQPELTGPQTS